MRPMGSTRKAILTYIQSHPNCSLDEASTAVGISKSTAWSHVQQLRKERYLRAAIRGAKRSLVAVDVDLEERARALLLEVRKNIQDALATGEFYDERSFNLAAIEYAIRKVGGEV